MIVVHPRSAIDFNTLDERTAAERARLVRALRDLADRLEQLPAAKAIDALPRVAGSIEDFTRRVRVVLRY